MRNIDATRHHGDDEDGRPIQHPVCSVSDERTDEGDGSEGEGGHARSPSPTSPPAAWDDEAGDDGRPRPSATPRLVSSIRVLDLHGNVGSGKSTLAAGIVRLCVSEGDYVEVSQEELDPLEIEKMCRDRRSNTFAFQMYCQRSRDEQFVRLYETLRDGYRYDPASSKSLLVVFDRSCLGDFVFAHYNQLQGNMTRDQLMEWSRQAVVPDHANALHRISGHYSMLRDGIDPAMEQEVFIAYLDKEPTDCKLQVDRVRRTAENTTPIHYYLGIHIAHQLLFNFIRESLEAVRDDPCRGFPGQHVFVLSPKPAIYYNSACFKGLIDDVRSAMDENKKRSKRDSPDLHRSMEAIHGLSVDH
jgi:hypothetical protein